LSEKLFSLRCHSHRTHLQFHFHLSLLGLDCRFLGSYQQHLVLNRCQYRLIHLDQEIGNHQQYLYRNQSSQDIHSQQEFPPKHPPESRHRRRGRHRDPSTVQEIQCRPRIQP